MRTTVVPAQITTVEDRIAGNLGLTQMLLLVVPIFIGSAFFVVLPPFFSYALYKVALIAITALLCGVFAIRVKGKILLFWAIAILRYNLRPTYYVFNKNSAHGRDTSTAVAVDEPFVELQHQQTERKSLPALSAPELILIQDVIANPAANLHFKTNRKGELSVHLTEVPHKSLGQTAN